MSKNYVSKVINVATKEVGYLEKATNSQLDSKTANAGYNNWNKYAEFFDKKHSDFYNGGKNGFHWCDIFVDWCFVTAYGYEEGRKLLCQPLHSTGAGCSYSAQFYKNKGQFHYRNETPKVGDQIFFGSDPYHTGLVYKVDSTYVYTIEGNTSSNSGVIANGGCVAKKQYYRTYSEIHGYGRPKYDAEPKSSTPTTNTNQKAKKVTAPTVTFKVRTGGKWLSEKAVGKENKAITDIAIKVSKGSVKYRVHVKGGGWLPYVTGYNTKDANNGYAGNGKAIDAIEVIYKTPSDITNSLGYYKAKYRVSPIGSTSYYSYQYDNEKSNKQDGYAGAIGKSIDKFEIVLSK